MTKGLILDQRGPTLWRPWATLEASSGPHVKCTRTNDSRRAERRSRKTPRPVCVGPLEAVLGCGLDVPALDGITRV